MNSTLPCGLLTALVTPFANGKVDFESYEHLLRQQFDARVEGVIVGGTTGEIPTLSEEEFSELLTRAIALRNKSGTKTVIIAGTGTNSTAHSIARTQLAERLGAEGFLVVAPYYNKPNSAGLFAHFSSIAEVTTKPIILYSIPGRCGIEIDIETVIKLHQQHPHICALKEASTNCLRVGLLRGKLASNFKIYAGDDEMILPFSSIGANGAISATANIFPKSFHQLIQHCLDDKIQEARQEHLFWLPRLKKLYCDVNPVPVKYALARRGIIASDEVRLPLVPLNKELKNIINTLLEDCPND